MKMVNKIRCLLFGHFWQAIFIGLEDLEPSFKCMICGKEKPMESVTKIGKR
jgi:hypothetical protein